MSCLNDATERAPPFNANAKLLLLPTSSQCPSYLYHTPAGLTGTDRNPKSKPSKPHVQNPVKTQQKRGQMEEVFTEDPLEMNASSSLLNATLTAGTPTGRNLLKSFLSTLSNLFTLIITYVVFTIFNLWRNQEGMLYQPRFPGNPGVRFYTIPFFPPYLPSPLPHILFPHTPRQPPPTHA